MMTLYYVKRLLCVVGVHQYKHVKKISKFCMKCQCEVCGAKVLYNTQLEMALPAELTESESV